MMTYSAIDYSEFAPFMIEKVQGCIKKITWNKIIFQEEIDSFGRMFADERTKVLVQTTTCMPFDVYIINAADANAWVRYIQEQKNLKQIFNCVYLLYGHDFIYAGKSVNGDRILGHIADETKKDFDYQMIFVPNNENPYTMTNWTSDFMAYLESLMIERINKNNPYCKNLLSGKSAEKNHRDLNLNEDKEAFAANVVNLIYEAFNDITYCSYLVPSKTDRDHTNAIDSQSSTSFEEDDSMMTIWEEIMNLSDSNSTFRKLIKPQKSNTVYRNMNKDGLIPDSYVNCVLTQSTCRVELVGWGTKNAANTNSEIYDKLFKHKEEIEEEFGCQLNWDRKDGKYTTNISLSRSLSYTDKSKSTKRDIADFFSEYFDKFYSILPKYYCL